jgi:hypothetical protein
MSHLALSFPVVPIIGLPVRLAWIRFENTVEIEVAEET